MAGFIKTMQAEEMQNYKNISIFCRVKSLRGEKSNIAQHHISAVYLKSNEKINCAIREIQWQAKSLKCGRIAPPSRWDGPERLPMEVRSQHDKTYELFLSLRTVKSLHFRSVRKVPVWSKEIVIIEHHLSKTKTRQRVSQHRISRHRLRKCLGTFIWYILLRTFSSVNQSESCF